MNLLLDTHSLIWWLEDDPRLSKTAYNAIRSFENQISISVASIWEIRIKQSLDRLELDENFDRVLLQEAFSLLNITIEHVNAIRHLPDLHRDPFDRILIAQAQVEGFTLVTNDTRIKKYDIAVL